MNLVLRFLALLTTTFALITIRKKCRKRIPRTASHYNITQPLECRLLLSAGDSSIAADIGVYRSGMWVFDREMDGYSGDVVSFNFGLANDVAVSGDFVGNDGREETVGTLCWLEIALRF